MDKSITSREYGIFLREFRGARKRAGVSQTKLAERVGETQSFVSKCERGERRLDVIELRLMCQAIGVPLTVFIEQLDQVLSTEPGKSHGRRRRR